MDQIYIDTNVREQPVDPKDPKTIALAESMKSPIGQIEPVKVTAIGNKYRLDVGHRRFEAAKLAGLPGIKALVVLELQDIERLRIQITENVHRSNLKDREKYHAISRYAMLRNISFSEAGKELSVLPATIQYLQSGHDVSLSLLSKIDAIPNIQQREHLVKRTNATPYKQLALLETSLLTENPGELLDSVLLKPKEVTLRPPEAGNPPETPPDHSEPENKQQPEPESKPKGTPGAADSDTSQNEHDSTKALRVNIEITYLQGRASANVRQSSSLPPPYAELIRQFVNRINETEPARPKA